MTVTQRRRGEPDCRDGVGNASLSKTQETVRSAYEVVRIDAQRGRGSIRATKIGDHRRQTSAGRLAAAIASSSRSETSSTISTSTPGQEGACDRGVRG